MEICGQDQQKKHYSLEITRTTCAAEYKTKENCGCEFIKPVSGFECHLCRIFIRTGNDIEEHISSCQHKTIYELHLQDHVQHQTGANCNHTNIIGENTEDHLTANQNHGIKEFDAGRNHFKINSVYGEGHEGEIHPGVRNTDEVTDGHFDQSGSDERINDPSKRCNPLLDEEERQSRFEGRNVKIEDSNIDNTELFERVSITELHTRRSYPCNVAKTSFQEEQEGAYTAIKIKQEKNDDDDYDDDYDDEDGIIKGFLEDTDDDLHNHNEHYKGELMPGYTIDNDLKTESIGQEVGHILTSVANSASIAEERCTTTISMSDNRWRASISENIQKHGIDGTSEADNCEKTSTIDEKLNVTSEANGNLDINLCDERQSLEKGNCVKRKRKHNGDIPFSYDVNRESFHLNGNLKAHERVHAGEEPYSRDVCGMKFRFPSIFNKHEIVYTVERPFSCNLCGKYFKRKTDLQMHERVHTGEKLFSYNVCQKSIKKVAYLKTHEKVNMGEKPYSCDVCGMKFAISSNCKQHKMVHTGEKPFSCNVCGKYFRQKATLQRHERLHTGEKPYSCNVCAKSFRRKATLQTHERLHTGEKPYSCDVCGMKFAISSNCKKHKIVHTGEKPFSCNVCGKSYRQKETLQRHERLHTGKKPYSCDVCGMKFAISGNCKKHKMVHTREKPFSCNVCGKSYKEKASLKRHGRVHTGKSFGRSAI